MVEGPWGGVRWRWWRSLGRGEVAVVEGGGVMWWWRGEG